LGTCRGEVLEGRDPISKRRASADASMPEGGLVKRLMMYVIPLSAVAVLVFATIAVAQSDPPATGRTTDVQNSTTWPPKKKPADTSTPTETADTSAPTETAETTAPTQTTAPDPNGQKTVNIYNHAFDPAQLNVASGMTVRFVNKDTEAHTATANNDLFDTGVLEPGGSFKVYFEGSGTVTYHCELHPDMKGSIVVGGGSGGEDSTAQKQASEVASNDEPSGEADQPATEAANHPEVIS
jgi:plastocyanin